VSLGPDLSDRSIDKLTFKLGPTQLIEAGHKARD
jgi:hypothetical protein